MKITFIAHSAFLVEWDKFYTLFDYVYEPDYTGTLPPLDPRTRRPVTAEQMNCIFAEELVRQEFSTERFIDIPDEDFGVWYVDVMDHPERYEGKLVHMKLVMCHSKKYPGTHCPGRFAMVCCENDVQFMGLVAKGMDGACTVTTTMMIAHMAGIRFFATGGIGGVHRGAEKTMDISADLQELANTPVCVVCAGAKSILDLGLTLEYLETQGVPVLGLRTDELPAFYCRTSGFKLDYNCQDEETVAKIMKAKWDIGLKGGAVVGNPIPEQYAMDPNYMNGIIDQAVAQANPEHIHGKAITPYLLAHIKELTGGESFASNVQLALNNARCAARIAVSLAKM